MVADLITERLGEDTRVTILGHVQRGGAPTAYDRWMPTLMGHAAALEVLGAEADHVSQLIGIHNNRVSRMPLMEAVAATQAIPRMIEAGDYAGRDGSSRRLVHRDDARVRRDRPARADVPRAGHPHRHRARRGPGAGDERRRAGGRPVRDLARTRHGGHPGRLPRAAQRPGRGSRLGRRRGPGRPRWRRAGDQPHDTARPRTTPPWARRSSATGSTACWSSAAIAPTRRCGACASTGATIPGCASRRSACPRRSTTTCPAGR